MSITGSHFYIPETELVF